VCAQETPSHVYVGAGAGRSDWHPGCPSSAGCENTDTMVRAFAGYQINGMFAAEAGFSNFGIIHDATSRIKAHAWEATGLIAWPPDTALSFYGKAGWFYSRAEGSGTLAGAKETNNGPTLGAGVQGQLTRRLDLRGELQYYWKAVGGATLPESGLTAVTVSALWRFH
jgi:opacity protein-like surface antigen